jgi:hypothetical protein
MSDDTETAIKLTGLGPLTPENQALAIREMSDAVRDRYKWSTIQAMVAVVSVSAVIVTCMTTGTCGCG